MAGENDNLSAAGFRKPLKNRLKPLLVVEHEAVVKDQRHVVLTALDEAGRRQPERQIHLVHGSAAGLLQRHQFTFRVQKNIQVLIDAHAVVNAPGDALDELGSRLVQIEPEGIPDRGGELRHGLLRQVDGRDLLLDAVVLLDQMLKPLDLVFAVG